MIEALLQQRYYVAAVVLFSIGLIVTCTMYAFYAVFRKGEV